MPAVDRQSWAGDIAASGLKIRYTRACAHCLTATTTPPWRCRCRRFDPEDLAPGITLVRLPGIAHLLLDTALHARPDNWQEAAHELRHRFALGNQEAVGVIWHEPADSAQAPQTARHGAFILRCGLEDTGSLVMETACGSGSLALALWCRKRSANSFRYARPSGLDLCVRFEPAAPLAWIDGPARLVAEGTAYL